MKNGFLRKLLGRKQKEEKPEIAFVFSPSLLSLFSQTPKNKSRLNHFYDCIPSIP